MQHRFLFLMLLLALTLLLSDVGCFAETAANETPASDVMGALESLTLQCSGGIDPQLTRYGLERQRDGSYLLSFQRGGGRRLEFPADEGFLEELSMQLQTSGLSVARERKPIPDRERIPDGYVFHLTLKYRDQEAFEISTLERLSREEHDVMINLWKELNHRTAPGLLPLAQRICGSYRRLTEDDNPEEADYLEYSLVGRYLVGEAESVMTENQAAFCYYAEELIPTTQAEETPGTETKETDSKTGDETVPEGVSVFLSPWEGEPLTFRIQRFSGFSMAGNYWDEPESYRLSVLNDRLLCFEPSSLNKAAEGTDTVSPDAASSDPAREAIRNVWDDSRPPQHDIRPHLELLDSGGAQNPHVPLPELEGAWECRDANGHHYLILENEMRRILYLNKKDGEPIRLYIGAWQHSEGEARLSCIAERLGWGGMPTEASFTFVLTEDGLSLRDEEENLLAGGELQLKPTEKILVGRLGLPERMAFPQTEEDEE